MISFVKTMFGIDLHFLLGISVYSEILNPALVLYECITKTKEKLMA